MKKFILPIGLFLFFLVFSSNVYAASGETTPSQKSSNSYNPYCWDTHMIKDISVCNKAYLSCVKPCPGQDLKANAVCLSACSKVHTDCLKSASAAYRACIEAEKQAQKQQEIKQVSPSEVPVSSSPQPNQTAKPNSPVKDVNQVEAISSWIRDVFGELDIEHIESGVQLERPQAITEQDQAIMYKAPSQASYSIGIINTEGDSHGLIKYPGSQEFTDIKMGDIPPGSIIKSRDDQIVIFTGTGEGGIIVVESDSEFTVPQTGPLDLSYGTVEIKEEKPSQQPVQPHDISTEFIDIFVIGTHYWITHEPGKQTTAGVYEGEVKVKTKDGKTALITPSGNKPGVVMVTQKLSIIKLVVAGLVLIAAVGGAIIFLKRKGNRAFRLKKKSEKNTI